MLRKNKSNSEGNKPSNNGGKALPIIALLVGALAIGLGAVNMMTGAKQKQVDQVVIKANQKFQNLELQIQQNSEVDPKLLEEMTTKIASSVQSQIGSKVDERINAVVDRKINDYSISVDEKLANVATNNSSMQPVVNGVQREEVLRIVSESARGLEIKAFNTTSQQNSRIKQIENQLERHSSMLQNASVKGTGEGSKFVPRKRLKEFNIVPPALRDGTLFAIDAPKKNGKINNITLKKGERFRSKHGAHTVEGIVKTEDGYRLLISGGYFIDEKREEFTKSELARMKASSKKKSSVTPPQSKSAPKKRVITAQDEGKLDMNGWYVVTTKPETKEVVVFNPEQSMPMSLKENMHVSGAGTVRTIDFTTGRTCFERFCIAGLQR